MELFTAVKQALGEKDLPDHRRRFSRKSGRYYRRLKTILQAIDYVKHGISICIFPEGTRNKGEELSLLPFHNGSFKIAEKTGCPIIPMSLNNTCDIFEGHFPFIKKDSCHLRIWQTDLSERTG